MQPSQLSGLVVPCDCVFEGRNARRMDQQTATKLDLNALNLRTLPFRFAFFFGTNFVFKGRVLSGDQRIRKINAGHKHKSSGDRQG